VSGSFHCSYWLRPHTAQFLQRSHQLFSCPSTSQHSVVITVCPGFLSRARRIHSITPRLSSVAHGNTETQKHEGAASDITAVCFLTEPSCVQDGHELCSFNFTLAFKCHLYFRRPVLCNGSQLRLEYRPLLRTLLPPPQGTGREYSYRS
jgi:hypothetical protein